MTRAEIELLCEAHELELLLLDGFDEAFMGLVNRFGLGGSVALYDYAKCIEILSRTMDEEEAEEFFQFNVSGAWVGEQTPMFFTRLT